MPITTFPAATSHGHMRRRVVAAILASAPAWCLGVPAQPAAGRRVTPAQTEGPFYPVVFPKDSDNDLLRNGALNYPEGQAVWLEGNVTDLAGRPVVGAQVGAAILTRNVRDFDLLEQLVPSGLVIFYRREEPA